MEYDPLLAKLALWAATRDDAIARAIRALREYEVGGIRTNIGFFRQIFEDPEYRAGRLHTGFIDEFFARTSRPPHPAENQAVAALAAALFARARAHAGVHPDGARPSPWLLAGREEQRR
jgi:acetyl-CoA carboxylase biotin carboxylase subunit